MLTLIVGLALAQTPQTGVESKTPPLIREAYECSGNSSKTPEGAYKMELTVIQKDDNYYLIWRDERGLQAKGFGLRVENNLSAVYQTSIGQVGVVNYTISTGQLIGTWTVGNGQTFPEECIPVGSLKI